MSIHSFIKGTGQFPIQKCAILCKFKKIKELCGGVLVYAAQAISQIDADLSRSRRGIAEKGYLWTETNYKNKVGACPGFLREKKLKRFNDTLRQLSGTPDKPARPLAPSGGDAGDRRRGFRALLLFGRRIVLVVLLRRGSDAREPAEPSSACCCEGRRRAEYRRGSRRRRRRGRRRRRLLLDGERAS